MSHVICSVGNSTPFGLPYHALQKFTITVSYFGFLFSLFKFYFSLTTAFALWRVERNYALPTYPVILVTEFEIYVNVLLFSVD